MPIAFLLAAIVVFIILITTLKSKAKRKRVMTLSDGYRAILKEKVDFYQKLSSDEKKQFESDVAYFLDRVRIVGVETEVEDLDRVLIAAGAVIPIFRFSEWMYASLTEVVLYPNAFDHNFRTKGPGRSISGMVGSGVLNGKVLLSKRSLRTGFSNITDKKNVAVHEFVHLIDGLDGNIDGVPELLLNNQATIPWMELMVQKIEEISDGDTNINPYGGTAHEEFFAVLCEYFFERPKLLKKKHPKVYEALNSMFVQSEA